MLVPENFDVCRERSMPRTRGTLTGYIFHLEQAWQSRLEFRFLQL